ncbi:MULTISPECIES: hypothetical protein [Olivibacter]|uniref:DUF4294 domain-containing protein n=1 Tax=Olivibacter jilunii TaxID=985016 RepID=A0ABW6AZ32_9SPHI
MRKNRYFYIMIVTLPIAVSQEVKLYLSSKLPVDPFVLTRKNKFGLFLDNCLSRYNAETDKLLDKKVDLSAYNDVLRIQLTESKFRLKGFYFSNEKQRDFNYFVTRIMYDDFYDYMLFHHQLNQEKVQQAILDWREKRNLNEDVLSYKTLAKSYERHRKERNELIIS